MNQAKISERQLPRHIAFIMDGNGRWAKKRGLPREHGHRFGVKAFEDILEYCRKLGIEVVTVYAFSTENWKRPRVEVDAIMKLMERYIAKFEQKSEEYNLRLCFLGDKGVFSPALRARMERLEQETAHRVKTLNIALNYGGRDDIVHACNRLIASGVSSVREEDISAALYTAHCGDPDLIVRTGGDLRISNFLLWQSAYSELYFTDVLWPDFDAAELEKALDEFSGRKRRFGGV